MVHSKNKKRTNIASTGKAFLNHYQVPSCHS